MKQKIIDFSKKYNALGTDRALIEDFTHKLIESLNLK